MPKSFSNNVIGNLSNYVISILILFFSFLAIPVVMPSLAYAAEDTAKLGKIEVTGYRIKRTDLEGPSPVLRIDRDAIEKSGASSLNVGSPNR